VEVYSEKIVEAMVDKFCDVCEESVVIDGKYEESGTLSARLGYNIKENGNIYHLDLCEKCFKEALFALRDKRRAMFMFDDDKDLQDENFGLVTQTAS
jgi:hypothetical protein